MLKKLLILSLCIIPFYEVILYFCIPGRSYPVFQDMRITKDFVSLALSVVIGSVVLFNYGFKPIKSIWFPALLVFLVINIYKSPNANLIIQGMNLDKLWNFLASYKIMVYSFLFIGVINSKMTKKDVLAVMKTVMYAGLAMSIIFFIQKLNMDQIFSLMPKEIRLGTKLPELGGTLGQATLSSPFIVMAVPFAIYFKKWLIAALMVIAVLLSGSSFAIAGLVCTILFTKIKSLKGIGAALVFSTILVLVFVYFNNDFLNANGRFDVWSLMVNDIFNGRIALTGAGIGAFKYLFAMRYHNTWYHAHNEYLQLMWGCGLIGCVIAGMMAKDFIKEALRNYNHVNRTIIASVIGMGVICCGTFILQLAAYQFYLVVLSALIYLSNKGEYYDENNRTNII